jgi:hypothetical protein
MCYTPLSPLMGEAVRVDDNGQEVGEIESDEGC